MYGLNVAKIFACERGTHGSRPLRVQTERCTHTNVRTRSVRGPAPTLAVLPHSTFCPAGTALCTFVSFA